MFDRDLRLSDGKGSDQSREKDHGYLPMCILNDTGEDERACYTVADPEGGPWVPWNPPFKENVLCGLLANYLSYQARQPKCRHLVQRRSGFQKRYGCQGL